MKVKIIYFYEIILALFILTLKFVLIDNIPEYYKIINSIFWIMSGFALYKLLGLKKNNKMVTKDATTYSIIGIMLFFLIIYLSGLFIGFLRNGYSMNLFKMIDNVYYLIIMIVSEEYIRYMVASNMTGNKKWPLRILTLLFIIIDFILVFNVSEVNTKLNIFVFVTTLVLPIIARHLLFSYNAKHFNYSSSIIIRLCITLYTYLLPIVPDLSYYLTSVIGLLFPYLMYVGMSTLVKNDERVRKINKKLWYLKVPIMAFLVVVIILISGIFKYQIMSIGSGSMEPVYSRGDAVIFEHLDSVDELNEGDILVFKHSGTYVTHRIVSISYKDGELTIKTKGDNNKIEDDFEVHEKDIVGRVSWYIKYIGYPSVVFQEFVN